MVVDRHLVGQMAPGTRVTAFGIYSIYSAKESGKGKVRPEALNAPSASSRFVFASNVACSAQDKSGLVAVRQPYLRVVGLEEDAEGNARSMPTFT